MCLFPCFPMVTPTFAALLNDPGGQLCHLKTFNHQELQCITTCKLLAHNLVLLLCPAVILLQGFQTPETANTTLSNYFVAIKCE